MSASAFDVSGTVVIANTPMIAIVTRISATEKPDSRLRTLTQPKKARTVPAGREGLRRENAASCAGRARPRTDKGGCRLRHGGYGFGESPRTVMKYRAMPETRPLVGVIMGSRSDWDTMQHAA